MDVMTTGTTQTGTQNGTTPPATGTRSPGTGSKSIGSQDIRSQDIRSQDVGSQDVGSQDIRSQDVGSQRSGPAETMRDRFVDVTTRILDRDPRTALVLADISVDRFRRSGALTRHPARIVNVGIREQAMIGVAAGLALEGFRVLAHSFAPFLVERPFEQVKLDLAHQGVAAILVGVGASDDIAAMGRTHQAPADVALLATLPGWEIHVPGHPDEVETILEAAARGDGNVYVRLSDQANRAPLVSAAGRVEVVRRAGVGAPIALAVGPMLDPLLDATSDLDLTVLYTATVRPLDGEALRAVDGGADAILVEPTLRGTSMPAFAEALGDRARRLLAIGEPAEELRRYGSAAEHQRAHGLDAAGLRRRIVRLLAARGRTPAGC